MENEKPRIWCLKVDVDTHDGMRDGVPRLLDTFKAYGVHATFFLSFGPDNAGKAIWNIFRTKGFLRKMLRTGAPTLYGWRTILSGTLLPARLIAVNFPDIVRRIADEGHEVGLHAWDHRLWQDHIERLAHEQIEDQFRRALDAYRQILGRSPCGAAAPAWCVTAASLRVQDALGLRYANDIRGGTPGYVTLDGYRSTTLQVPTTQPCLEELLTLGQRDLSACAEAVLTPPSGTNTCVIPLHAEVEGGPYGPFLELILNRLKKSGAVPQTLLERSEALLAEGGALPRFAVSAQSIPGRAGSVISPLR